MPKSADMRALGEFAASHHGTFNASQAARNGISRNDLVRLQRDGSVIRIRRGVYRLTAHPVDWRQASYASTLAVRAAASHRTADALHGSDGVSPPARPDIACHHHAAVDLAGVTSHRTTWLPKSDVTEIDGIPCTTLIRTIIDLAGIADDATLIRIGDDAQRRRVDLSCLLAQATMMMATGRSGPSNVIDIVRRRLDGIPRARVVVRTTAQHELAVACAGGHRSPARVPNPQRVVRRAFRFGRAGGAPRHRGTQS